MNKIQSLLVSLGIRRESTLSEITRPMNKIVSQLEQYADAKEREASKNAEAARDLIKRSEEEGLSSMEARGLAARYNSLTV